MSTVRAPSAVDPTASEIRRLSTLLEASQALSGTLNLKAALHRVLEVLCHHHGALRSAVVLVDEASGRPGVGANGDGNGRGPRSRAPVITGIVTRVLESGRPVVVPQVSREPLLNGGGPTRP